MLQDWTAQGTPKVSLDAAGLVALADIQVIAQRTAYTGTSALLDTLVLCPGLHRQQTAPELNGGEYPAVAAMTSGRFYKSFMLLEKSGPSLVSMQHAIKPGLLSLICCSQLPLFEPDY